MELISGFGTRAWLVATGSFPVGAELSSFADDADPLDMPAIPLIETSMSLNGDLIGWSNPNLIIVTTNIIAGTEDDILLSTIAEANRTAKGKNSTRDTIFLTVNYPDGRIIQYINGLMTNAPMGVGIASSGRFKTQQYQFTFENRVGV